MWIRSLCCLFLLHLPLAADSVADTTLGPPTTQVSEEGEWQQLCNRHQVKSWYMEALENLDAFETREEVTELSILRLYEYHDKGRFDRKTSPVRKSIEKDILADIEEVMAKEPQGTPVRLLSLGSEGLLQDWFIVGQLIRQGKTQIDLTIVNKQLVKGPYEEFEKLCKALKSEGITINLSFFPSVEQCAKIQKLPFHCVYAVNYCALLTFKKDTWRNLVSARKIVAPAGHLFVSYLDEILTIDSNGKISVVETWSGNKRLRDIIVAAQRSNPRSKDSSIRVQMVSVDPFFTVAPLLYAVSDLLQDGYRDIIIYTFSANIDDGFSEADLSELFSDLFVGKGHAMLHWKRRYYINGNHEDRRDMVIFNLRNLEIHDLVDTINRAVIYLSPLVPADGRWIVCADQLGLWVIDGNGHSKIIGLPEKNQKTAKELMAKIFAPGLCWH